MNIEDLGSPLDTLSPKGKVITPDDVPYIKGEVVRSDLAPDFEDGEHHVDDLAWHEDSENDWHLYQCDEDYTGDFDSDKWHIFRMAGILDNEGKPSDKFVTECLGKQVANAKVRYALSTTASAAMADRTVNLYEMNGNGTITFPTATTHEGVTYARDFLLRVKVTTAGSLTLPTDVTPLGDSFDFTKANDWLIAFTEIGKDANNKAEFYIRAISLEG